MKIITKNIVGAFLKRLNKSCDNTTTNGNSLFLFENEIARHTVNGIEITNAGWFSKTTKERLNAIPGVSISIKNRAWFLNGVKWNGAWARI